MEVTHILYITQDQCQVKESNRVLIEVRKRIQHRHNSTGAETPSSSRGVFTEQHSYNQKGINDLLYTVSIVQLAAEISLRNSTNHLCRVHQK